MIKTRRSSLKICTLALVLLLGLACLSPPLLSAADAAGSSIGKVIALRGHAEASAAGKTRDLAMAATIDRDEVIRTGRQCRMQIMFNDNTIISLGPQSELVVEDYLWNGEGSPAKMKSVIREGVFRVLGGSITRSAPENFTTETPSATIGIRGSMYAGKVRNGSLQVVFQGGKGIYVRNALGIVDIRTPGYGTRVASREAPPEEPYRVPAAELQQLDPLAARASDAGETADSGADEVRSDPVAGDESDDAASVEIADGEVRSSLDPEVAAELVVVDPPQVAAATQRTPSAEIPGINAASQATVDASDSRLRDQVVEVLPTEPPVTEPPVTEPPVTEPPVTEPPVVSQVVSGRYMAVQDDLDLLSNANDAVLTGTVAGDTTDGTLLLQADSSQGIISIDPLTVDPFDSAAAYSGYTKRTNQTRTTTLLDQTYIFNSVAVGSDNTGQFAIMVLDELFNTPTYSYRELGFAGVPSLELPATGIDRYRGPMLLVLQNLSSPEFEGMGNNFAMWVNWHNSKMFGIIETPGINAADPVEVNGFFFGDLNGTGLANVKFVGMDIAGKDPVVVTDPAPQAVTGDLFMPLAIDGTTSFAQFYGLQAQGIGLVAEGNTYDVMTQTAMEGWQFTAAGFREAGLTTEAKTGTTLWEGFTVGIGDDMTAPDQNRRVFMNITPEDFSLTVDRDNGRITGILNADDQNDTGVALRGLQIGGSSGSVYIDDNLIAAGLGGPAPVVSGAISTALKEFGNYLIVEDPAKPIASYASWGTWEIAYDDPDSSLPYHVHNPGTYWVAGERTPVAEVQDLIDTNFTATYSGGAAGVMIPEFGSFSNLNNGTSHLTIDFGPGASAPVSGSLDFTEVSLPIMSGLVNSSNFYGQISGANNSSLQGVFYGPGAASVGGSFDAMMPTGERFTGVFGGDR